MKIAIDIRRITQFGIGTYTRNVVRAWAGWIMKINIFSSALRSEVEEIGPLPPNFQNVPLAESDTTAQGLLSLSRNS